MGEGSAKFLIGAAVGAVGGFALGSVAATPTARSAGSAVVMALGNSARFIAKTTVRAADELGSVVESGYTKVRGREAYLEHEISQLRDKISDLEKRMD
ncbi:MAG: hypothetical protein H0U65_09590 [Rubrobacter sp.]|nr:hypothetical protein [Rubrobacter sp.]